MAADVALRATPLLSDPAAVFPGAGGRFGFEHGYDVAPDGKSLGLVELGGGDESGGDLLLIAPWPNPASDG